MVRTKTNHGSKSWFLFVILFFSNSPVGATQYEPLTINEPPTKSQKKLFQQQIEKQKKLFQLDMFPGWFKPRTDVKSYKGCSRLVVKLMPDGSAILNPKGEQAGWSSDTIDLKGLSLENAEMLWGKQRGLTFDLLAGPRQLSSDNDVYHLDTKFIQGKLSSYRLRGIDITNPKWITVE